MSLRIPLLAAAVASAAWFSARPAAAADTYQSDPAHSSLVFRIKHMNTSFVWGRFNEFSGTFLLDDQDPGKSRIEFTVKAGSIDTGIAKRDQHLKGPDFFNAAQFPTITFKSKSVTSAGPGQFDVAGDLTLHGVTQPVTIRVNRTGSGRGMAGPIAGIEATFTVKQSNFKMPKPMMAAMLSDEVWVSAGIEGVKKK